MDMQIMHIQTYNYTIKKCVYIYTFRYISIYTYMYIYIYIYKYINTKIYILKIDSIDNPVHHHTFACQIST